MPLIGMIGVVSGPGCGRGVVALPLPISLTGISECSIFIPVIFWLTPAGSVGSGMSFFFAVVMPGISIPAMPDMSMPFISPIFLLFIVPIPISAMVRMGNESIGGTVDVMPVFGARV